MANFNVVVDGVQYSDTDIRIMRKRMAELEAQVKGHSAETTEMIRMYQECKAENERLRKTLDECADDLESYVEHEYASMHDYPDIHRRYERDIELVRKARKLLAAMEGK